MSEANIHFTFELEDWRASVSSGRHVDTTSSRGGVDFTFTLRRCGLTIFANFCLISRSLLGISTQKSPSGGVRLHLSPPPYLRPCPQEKHDEDSQMIWKANWRNVYGFKTVFNMSINDIVNTLSFIISSLALQ